MELLLSLWLIILTLWQDPLWILHLKFRRFSKSGWWKTPLLALCKLQAWFPLLMLWWFFFFLVVFFHSMVDVCSVEYWRGTPEDLQHFVPCALSCPVNSSCFGLWTLSSVFSWHYPCIFRLPLSFLNHTLEMLSTGFGASRELTFLSSEVTGFFVVVVAWCTVSWKPLFIYFVCFLLIV